MTNPTPQPACSPLDYSVRSDGATIHFAAPNGATRAIVTTFCDQELLRIFKNAPETARLLRELAAKVQELGYFRQANLQEIEECGTPAEVEVATSELAMWETEFTALLTQIQKLEGGWE